MTPPIKITRRRLALLTAAVAWLPLAAFSLVQTVLLGVLAMLLADGAFAKRGPLPRAPRAIR